MGKVLTQNLFGERELERGGHLTKHPMCISALFGDCEVAIVEYNMISNMLVSHYACLAVFTSNKYILNMHSHNASSGQNTPETLI